MGNKALAKKLILDVNDELWEQFKKTVPRGVTLNNAIVHLIEKEVKEKLPRK